MRCAHKSLLMRLCVLCHRIVICLLVPCVAHGTLFMYANKCRWFRFFSVCFRYYVLIVRYLFLFSSSWISFSLLDLISTKCVRVCVSSGMNKTLPPIQINLLNDIIFQMPRGEKKTLK